VVDRDLFSGLKEGDKSSIRTIYSTLFPVVRKWVIENNGNEEDAYDIFQETLEVILLKVDALNSNLKSLVMRIAKNKWIDLMRRTKTNRNIKDQILYIEQQTDLSAEEKTACKEQLKYRLMEKYFLQLSSTCQQLLELLKQGLKVEQVVSKLSFSNSNTLYRRKAACIERWSTLIKQDSKYPTLHE